MLRSSPSAVSLTRSRRPSLSQVLGATPPVPRRKSENTRDPDSKAEDWIEGRGSSDDEAIDIVAAGASGGEALDERTSARHSVPSPSHGIETTPITLANSGRSPSTPNTRRNRPHPPPVNATLANPSRHKVAVALLSLTQNSPRWETPNALYSSSAPCPPRITSIPNVSDTSWGKSAPYFAVSRSLAKYSA